MIKNLYSLIKKQDKLNINYILSKGGISLLFRVIGTIINFLIIWFITNKYSSDLYGGFAIIQTIIQILVIIFSLGVQNLLIIEIDKLNENKDLYYNIFIKVIILVFFTSLIPMLIFHFFSNEISISVFNKPSLSKSLTILSYGLFIFVLHDVILYYFIAKKQFASFGFFMFIFPNILFLYFLFHNTNIINQTHQIVYYFLISFIITFIFEFLIVSIQDFSLKKVKIPLKYILKISLPMMLSGATMYLLNWTDILMLGAMRSEAEVAIYNVGFKIGFFVLIIIASMNIIATPVVRKLYALNKKTELRKFVNQTTQITTLITFPFVLIIVIFNQYLLHFFGNDFSSQGRFVLIIITIGTFINAMSGNVDQILNMTENQNLLLKINVISLLVNIILNLLLIPTYGINGAAISSFISTVFMNGISIYFIRQKLGFITFYSKNIN